MDNSFLLLLMGGAIIVAGFVLLAVINRQGVRTKLDVDNYEAQLKAVVSQLNEGNTGRHLAVMNADKLLDRAMKELGFRGDTMGERLKNGRPRFSDINGVWEAHKLRNRIAHEHDVHISYEQAERAITQLRRGLRDLGAVR